MSCNMTLSPILKANSSKVNSIIKCKIRSINYSAVCF